MKQENRQLNLSLTSEIMISLGLLMVVAVALIGLISLAVLDATIKSGQPAKVDFIAETIMRNINRSARDERFTLSSAIVDISPYVNINDVAMLDADLKSISGYFGLIDLWEKEPAGEALKIKKMIKKEKDEELFYYIPVIRQDLPVGIVRLKLPSDAASKQQRIYKKLLVMYIVLDSAIILLFGVYLLRRRIVKPLHNLIAHTEKISSGNLQERIVPSGGRELVELSNSFNIMARSLEEKQKELQEKIKELEQANRELLAARDEVRNAEKLATIGKMASGIAHELGNPISSIMGYVDLLNKKPADDKFSEYISKIKNDISRMDSIIREMLDFARPKKTVFEKINLRDTIEKSIEMTRTQRGFDRIRINIHEDSSAVCIMGDLNQLKQVWVNLLINSRDAMPDGGSINIRIKEDNDSNQAIVDFSDTGSGIAEDNIERIFDPFFSTKDPGKGTGLGLTVVQRIILSMKGKINVQSEINKGTTFTIILPTIT